VTNGRGRGGLGIYYGRSRGDGGGDQKVTKIRSRRKWMPPKVSMNWTGTLTLTPRSPVPQERNEISGHRLIRDESHVEISYPLSLDHKKYSRRRKYPKTF